VDALEDRLRDHPHRPGDRDRRDAGRVPVRHLLTRGLVHDVPQGHQLAESSELAVRAALLRPPLGSEQLAAATIDRYGRTSPGNAARLAALVRRLHPDVQVACGAVVWTVPTADGHTFTEIAVPTDWVVATGDGAAGVVPDPEAG
jgi:hypothetical protein